MAQFRPTAIKFYDLRAMLDMEGNEHLFYRIEERSESGRYFANSVRHWNLTTNSDRVLFRSFSEEGTLFSTQDIVTDYGFFNRDPGQYIYSGIGTDVFGYIVHYDRPQESFGGHLIVFDKIHMPQSDTGLVYANYGVNKPDIGFSGGREWPSLIEPGAELPDSVILDFPLSEKSPFDPNLMFGIDGNQFVRSIDAGATKETISNSISPLHDIVAFDADREHVYVVDYIPGTEDAFGLFASDDLGGPGSWAQKGEIFDERVTVVADTTTPGRLFIWGSEQVLVSEDFGASFNVFATSDDDPITGFATLGDMSFFSTVSGLFRATSDEIIRLKSLPVSNEEPIESTIPGQVRLLDNFPNPFNPSTTIRFELPVAQNVTIQVFDVLGRVVMAPIRNERIAAGEHSVSIDFSNGFSSGVYFYTLRTEQHSITRTMTLLK